jgi:hypothetical protein
MQILYGNGDGTFTPTYVSYLLGKRYVPQFAADLNADGRADLIELDNYTASFNVVKSVASGAALQLEMLTTPVSGGTGSGRVTLNVPAATATTVSFSTSDPAVSVPSVVMPAGVVSQDFQFSVGSGVNAQKVFSIQAQAGIATATVYNYVSTLATPVMEFTPTGVIFEGVVSGSKSTQPVTLKNIGSGTLTITAISTSMPFSETDDCGSGLALGASCTIQATFNSPFPGDSLGGMSIYYNVSGVSGNVTLEGIGISPLQITPCCLGFSQLNGGTSAALNISLSNVGTVPIQVSSIVPSSGFSATNGCTTIAVGGTCQISVTFTPSAAGAAVGSLSLNTNVPNATAFIVPLSGNAMDFSLGSAASVTVSAGQPAKYNLSATGIDGFSGSIDLSCGGGPSSTNCTVSPSTVTLSVDGAAAYLVTVTTSPNPAAALLLGPTPSARQGSIWADLLTLPLFGIVIACGKSRKLRGIVGGALVCCFALILVFAAAVVEGVGAGTQEHHRGPTT